MIDGRHFLPLTLESDRADFRSVLPPAAGLRCANRGSTGVRSTVSSYWRLTVDSELYSYGPVEEYVGFID